MTLVFFADPALQSSAGIERYTRELISALMSSEWADRTVLLTSDRLALSGLLRQLNGELPVVEVKLSARALRYSWAFTGHPAVDRLVKRRTGRTVRLVHNPTNMRTPVSASRQLVTIHDAFALRAPTLLSRRQRLGLTRQLESRAIRFSRHMIADSRSTKHDVMELFDVPDERITVIPLGVDHAWFHPCPDPQAMLALRDRLGLPARFVLYVGSLYSRKLGRLLDAYQKVHQRFGPESCKLVIVGGRESTAAGEAPLDERVRRLGLSHSVVRTGVLAASDVPLLMSAATVFTYVSFFEGFGLSPLEAMACGAPVIASNTTSLPEVVGDAGLLVDPQDTEAISHAILRVLEDDELAADLRSRSLARAREFSWNRTARETFACYSSLMEQL